jgi:flagellar biogenesis protein FliO
MNLRAALSNGSTRPAVERKPSLVPPTFSMIAHQLQSLGRRISGKYVAQRQSRRLKVSETVSLGEKRFASILQVDGAQFLIAGTPDNITLLATLDSSPDFAQVLKAQAATPDRDKQ